jgi:hypothetical protein
MHSLDFSSSAFVPSEHLLSALSWCDTGYHLTI